MNEYGVLTTYSEVMNHNGSEYQFPDKEEVIDARLDFRAWGKKWSLGCFFTTLDGGRKLLLNAWGRAVGVNNQYQPQKSNIDFSKVKDNTLWRVSIKKNSKGKFTWVKASPLD